VKRLGPLRRFVVIVVKTVLTPMTSRTWAGQEHIPKTGGAILAVNHLSHADPLVCAHYVYDAGRWPRFLGKASLFRVPVFGWIITQVEQIPVERGSLDAAKSLEAMVAAVKGGKAVIIYPEGTTTREPDLWPMRGKTGAARVALATGAPVIPIAQWGAQRLFDPRTRKVGLRPRTPISFAAGPPVDLSRWAGADPTRATLDEMSDEIMLRIRDLLAGIRGETPPELGTSAKGEHA
jgi:1-acyl-sn-glycerol-3-phosphate acyltransferase